VRSCVMNLYQQPLPGMPASNSHPTGATDFPARAALEASGGSPGAGGAFWFIYIPQQNDQYKGCI